MDSRQAAEVPSCRKSIPSDNITSTMMFAEQNGLITLFPRVFGWPESTKPSSSSSESLTSECSPSGPGAFHWSKKVHRSQFTLSAIITYSVLGLRLKLSFVVKFGQWVMNVACSLLCKVATGNTSSRWTDGTERGCRRGKRCPRRRRWSRLVIHFWLRRWIEDIKFPGAMDTSARLMI